MVDLAIIKLLEDHKLNKSAFVSTEDYHTRQRQETAKLLVESIKSTMNTRATHKKKQYMYDKILQDNVQNLANYIQDKSKELHFNIPSIVIARNDDQEIRERILKMTPDKRRELGINKSTLWQIQKNLREGKKIKLYDKVRTKMEP